MCLLRQTIQNKFTINKEADQSRSTSLGSMAMAPGYKHMPAPAYKISKAALNMLTVQYAQDLADEGFTVFAISPGVGLRMPSLLSRNDICVLH